MKRQVPSPPSLEGDAFQNLVFNDKNVCRKRQCLREVYSRGLLEEHFLGQYKQHFARAD